MRSIRTQLDAPGGDQLRDVSATLCRHRSPPRSRGSPSRRLRDRIRPRPRIARGRSPRLDPSAWRCSLAVNVRRIARLHPLLVALTPAASKPRPRRILGAAGAIEVSIEALGHSALDGEHELGKPDPDVTGGTLASLVVGRGDLKRRTLAADRKAQLRVAAREALRCLQFSSARGRGAGSPGAFVEGLGRARPRDALSSAARLSACPSSPGPVLPAAGNAR